MLTRRTLRIAVGVFAFAMGSSSRPTLLWARPRTFARNRGETRQGSGRSDHVRPIRAGFSSVLRSGRGSAGLQRTSG